MDNLKNRVINGLLWSVVERFALQGTQFILGIFIARLLTPQDYGLIGMIAIFLSISQSFIDSGFSQALIQKKDTNEKDFSTVFYFNLLIAISIYLILYFLAKPISLFYENSQLIAIIQVIGFNLIFSAFSIVPIAKLSKNLDFKTLTKSSLISVMISGAIAIYLAYQGWGVWVLVIQTLLKSFINSILLYTLLKWKPLFLFSKKSFDSLFSFGSKLLATGLLNAVYNNIYLIVIGKIYNANQLGLYTRADQFQQFASENITTIIQRVTYSALCSIQDKQEELERYYKKLIRLSAFVIFPLLIGLGAVAEPFIILILTEKWSGAIPFLQMLVFVGVTYPVHAINLDILKVKGKTNLFLKLEIYKKIVITIVLLATFSFGIKVMIIGQIVSSFLLLYLNTYYTKTLINYTFFNQLKDLLPTFLLSISMGLAVHFAILPIYSNILKLLVGILVGSIFYISFAFLFKFEEAKEVKNLISSMMNKKKSKGENR